MKIFRTQVPAFLLGALALLLVLPQVDLPDAVNPNATALVAKSVVPSGPVSVRIANLHHHNPLHAFGSEISLAGEVVLHPHMAPALSLLCSLRC